MVLECHPVDGGFLVVFDSEYGSARARWGDQVPEAGLEYQVEIEIPGVLHWGSDIISTSGAQPSIQSEADKMLLVGVLESASEDGVAVVRLGDTTFMIETNGPAPSVGSNLLIQVNELILYDTRA